MECPTESDIDALQPNRGAKREERKRVLMELKPSQLRRWLLSKKVDTGGVSELAELASLAVENGLIADFGSMDDFPGIADWKGLEVIDASGRIVMPCYVDSHTHIVYAGNREQEFVDRINGLSYEEIFKRGGGILNSAARVAGASEDELF